MPVEDRRIRPERRGSAGAGQESITEPAKLLRIASMVRELLDETRQASLDEAGGGASPTSTTGRSASSPRSCPMT